MVEFGKELLSKRRAAWADYYIDYDQLKAIIKQNKKKLSEAEKESKPASSNSNDAGNIKGTMNSSASVGSLQDMVLSAVGPDKDHLKKKNDQIAILGEREFQSALDQNIEKVVLFLLKQQGHLASELQALNIERRQLVSSVLNKTCNADTNAIESILFQVQQLLAQYQAAGDQVLEFVYFVELNVTAVRKILKKHDKQTPSNRNLSKRYLSTVYSDRTDSYSHLHQLYHYGGLSALVCTLQSSFYELRLIEHSLQEYLFGESQKLLLLQHHQEQQQQQQQHQQVMVVLDDSEADFQSNQTQQVVLGTGGLVSENVKIVPDAINRQLSALSAGTEGMPDNTSIFYQQLSTPVIKIPKEPILKKIQAARSRLSQSTQYVEVIAAQAMMFDREEMGEEEGYAEESYRDAMTKQQQLSSFLNLCSTFLYMTNYYIVAPTCGRYANRLGSNEAMAGIIIGMTPNAALIATVLYGWWSNYSYKSALLFAAMSSILGNVFYALALSYNSLTMVMIGRFLNGFGSARSINRRFIADTFSRRDRTAASAAFVTAGALGMAVGPAIAAVLGRLLGHQVEDGVEIFKENHLEQENLLWTVETSPGWVMGSLWTIFFIVAIFGFQEPKRNYDKVPITLEVSSSLSSEKKRLLSVSNGDGSFGNTEGTTTYGGDVSYQLLKQSQSKQEQPLYKNIAVMMTLWIYFVLKLVLECLLSSSSTVTKIYFNWNAQQSGTFLAFLGLLMFPANMVVAKLSHQYEDRELIYVTLVVMFCSVVGVISYNNDSYPLMQYVVFGICIFLSTNILEGPNMSLLSKTIPKKWARGTFNSGFLATEAGTAARSVGDVIISAAAGFAGFAYLLNLTFLPLCLMVFVTIFLTRRYYEYLVEADDDDDDSASKHSSRSKSSNNNNGKSH